MPDIEIGVAVIEYNPEGNAVSGQFNPSDFNMKGEELGALLKACHAKTPQGAKANAEAVMVRWFSQVNNVELADREKYRIASKMIECEKWPTGEPRRCKIRFTLVER